VSPHVGVVRGEIATVRARSRRSRFVTRVTLLAAAAVISSSLAVPGAMPTAGLLLASTARPHQAALLAENPALLPPLAGRRSLRIPRVARALVSAAPSVAQASERSATLPVLWAMGAVLTMGLGRWLLEFVGKSSRTRGQPRVGEFAL
jgi:hypothetical protein